MFILIRTIRGRSHATPVAAVLYYETVIEWGTFQSFQRMAKSLVMDVQRSHHILTDPLLDNCFGVFVRSYDVYDIVLKFVFFTLNLLNCPVTY